MNRKPEWTPEQVAEILRLYQEQHSLHRVGAAMGCSWSRIRPVIPRKMMEAVANAARHHNHRPRNSHFTPAEAAEAVALYAELGNVVRVARSMHTGERRVRKALAEAGVLRRQGANQPKRIPGEHRGAPPIVGCAIPRTRQGTYFCSECPDQPPMTCLYTCDVGRIVAGECDLMAACPCAHTATAERLAAFNAWKSNHGGAHGEARDYSREAHNGGSCLEV